MNEFEEYFLVQMTNYSNVGRDYPVVITYAPDFDASDSFLGEIVELIHYPYTGEYSAGIFSHIEKGIPEYERFHITEDSYIKIKNNGF